MGLSMDGPAAYLQGVIRQPDFILISVTESLALKKVLLGAVLTTLSVACAPERQVPHAPEVEFVCAVTIGDAMSAPLEFPVDAAWSERSNFVVVDQMAPAVHTFDSTGALVRTLGRKGRGPGELVRPWTVAVEPSTGTMAIVDEGRSRVLIWAPDGAELGTIQAQGLVARTVSWLSPDTLYVLGIVSSGGPGAALRKVDVRTGSSTETVSESGTFTSLLGGKSRTLCIGCPADFDAKGNYAMAPSSADRYLVRILDAEGRADGAIERDVAPLPYTEEQKEALRRERDAMPAHLRPFMSSAEHKSVISALSYDDRGFLWVQTPDEDGSRLDVYSPDGAHHETVRIADPIRLLDARQNAILGLATSSETDEMLVRVYVRR